MGYINFLMTRLPNVKTEICSLIPRRRLRRNRVAPDEVGGFVIDIHAALRGLGVPVAEPEKIPAGPSPAHVKKSISKDGLVSFIDGRSYQALKRHLTAPGMTPEDYREKFGLPPTYPMVAQAYSAKRSALAKANGLGRASTKAAR